VARLGSPETAGDRRPSGAVPKQPAPAPRLPGYVTLGAGAAFLVTGSIFGLMAIEKRAELDGSCPTRQCPSDQAGDLASLGHYSDLATVGIAAGLVGVAAGTFMIFRAGGAPEPARAGGAGTRFWVGASSVGIERIF